MVGIKLKKPMEFCTNSHTPNLYVSILDKILEDETVSGQNIEGSWRQIHSFILDQPSTSAGTVYCMTQVQCEKVATWLSQQEHTGALITTAHYHGGMISSDRSQVYKDFMTGKIRVVVATNAFGMGVDKADVGWIVHHTMPQSIEAYVQEIGRAGRVGEQANCVLLFSPKNLQNIKIVFQKNTENQESKRSKLKEMAKYCFNTKDCRHQMLLDHFGDQLKVSRGCKMCDVCATPTGLVLTEAQEKRGSGGKRPQRSSHSSLEPDQRKRR